MILFFKCHSCPDGNEKNALEYADGTGYSAIVCSCCGAYFDHHGFKEADSWSRRVAGLVDSKLTPIAKLISEINGIDIKDYAIRKC